MKQLAEQRLQATRQRRELAAMERDIEEIEKQRSVFTDNVNMAANFMGDDRVRAEWGQSQGLNTRAMKGRTAELSGYDNHADEVFGENKFIENTQHNDRVRMWLASSEE